MSSTWSGQSRLYFFSFYKTTIHPISCRLRRYSDFENSQIREIVDDLLHQKIIYESNFFFSSQVALVKKKDLGNKLVVDYRRLNQVTVCNRYPLPLIEDQLNKLASYKYFISLDLYAGYHQISMSPESIPYTSFVTVDGQYEFLCMLFGLCNAPAVFQRMINTVLGQLCFTKVCVYLDDILIPGKTPQECLAVFHHVLKFFKGNGLTLKLPKCCFLKTSIDYFWIFYSTFSKKNFCDWSFSYISKCLSNLSVSRTH